MQPDKPVTATQRVRELNDALRATGGSGMTVITKGIATLPDDQCLQVLEAVRRFDQFTPDNDPFGQHDCAVLDVEALRVIWKIDYFNIGMDAASDDPADPAITTRVLTIMLADEY